MFHLDWPFLEPQSITIIYVAAPVMSCYGNLLNEAISITSIEIHRVFTPLNHRQSNSFIY